MPVYENDLYEGLGESDSDDSGEYDRYIPAIQAPLNREQFEYYWGEDLLDLYYSLLENTQKRGLLLFEKLSYMDFLQLAFSSSSLSKPAE